MISRVYVRKALIMLALAGFLLAGCDRAGEPTVTGMTAAPDTPGVTVEVGEATSAPTEAPPSPTAVPLALRVDGVEVTLAEYEAELALYRAASGVEPTEEDEQRVLDDLIDGALLANAAAKEGYLVADEVLEERLAALADQMGGPGALEDWMATYGYTQESFKRALRRSMEAAWMRDQILADQPERAVQVYARQILLYNSDQVQEVYASLEAGNDFGNLALEYDPLTGGQLGWFPRGYLPDANLEAAAFSLEPGQYTPVIETSAGFHILQALERDPERLLAPDARLILQAQALEAWLAVARSESDFQVLLP